MGPKITILYLSIDCARTHRYRKSTTSTSTYAIAHVVFIFTKEFIHIGGRRRRRRCVDVGGFSFSTTRVCLIDSYIYIYRSCINNTNIYIYTWRSFSSRSAISFCFSFNKPTCVSCVRAKVVCSSCSLSC